jgi:fumarate reductase subunit C
MRQLSNPLYIAFHALALVCVVFVAVRFFGLFPKAQPAHIGPAKPPPAPLIQAGLYAAWLGVTLVVTVILAGGIF